MKPTKHITIKPELLEELVKEAGFQNGDEVLVSVQPERIELRRDPVKALWGSLKSSKKTSQLRNEAYEELGDLISAKKPH
jgi:hypothetical protein